MQFIFDSKIKTNKLIKQDITRYFLKKDNNVVEYVKPLIDKHEIFQTKAPSFLIDYIQPQYVVHELAYDNLILLRNKIMAQSRNCKMY